MLFDHPMVIISVSPFSFKGFFLLQRIIDCMLNFDFLPMIFLIPWQLVNNLYFIFPDFLLQLQVLFLSSDWNSGSGKRFPIYIIYPDFSSFPWPERALTLDWAKSKAIPFCTAWVCCTSIIKTTPFCTVWVWHTVCTPTYGKDKSIKIFTGSYS